MMPDRLDDGSPERLSAKARANIKDALRGELNRGLPDGDILALSPGGSDP